MRKIALLCSALLLCGFLVFAQKTVTGKVTDEKGDPVPFATVTIKGTNKGISADVQGNYSIAVPDNNAVLVVSSQGFSAQEFPVGNSSSLNFSLKSEGQLQEVVVTALGIKRQKKDLGYSTAKVSNETVNRASPVNIANGLQGKVAGLNITTVNGGVFESVKINLRGLRSLTGDNNPMLLLDGIPADISFLSSINPHDILDVNVLKGSSGAAIYGPDARNGVIVVTTKKGTTNDRPVITLGHSTQLQQVSFYPEFQTQFGSGGYKEYIPYENWSWGPAFDGSMVEIGHGYADGSGVTQDVVYSPNNSRKQFFNTGVTLQNDISIAAKDFFLSVQDANIKGIVPNDKNRRTGVRMNTGKDYGKFRVGFNMNYIQSNYSIFDESAMSQYNFDNNVGANDGLMNLIFNTPAHIPLTSYKDYVNNPAAEFNGYFNDYGLNPYFALDNWRVNGKRENFIGGLDMTFKATNWLSVTYRAAAIAEWNTNRSYSRGVKPSELGLRRSFALIPARTNEGSSRESRLSSEVFATANKKFGDLGVNVIVGQYFRQNDRKTTNVSASNLVVPNLYNVGARTGELGGTSNSFRSRLFSVYGSVGLSYKGWANVEVTGRNDVTSLLAIDNNSYFYPGVSGSLVVSDLFPGMDRNFLSYLKLRGAWNKTGNADIAEYSLAATYSQPAGFPFGSLPGYTADNKAADANLKPEFISSTEFGAEVSFMKNRINIEATYFHQDNTDQIISIATPVQTGYTTYLVNAASFVNKGVELDLRLTPLIKLGEVNIDFNANATYNDSKITSIYSDLDELFAGGFDNFAANYAIKGRPAFVFKATDYVRDPATGKVIVDADGEPTADPSPKIFGRTQPLWILGFGPNVTWKGFRLSALAEYRGGHYAYHNIGPDMAWTGVSAATAYNNRERFVIPNSVYDDGTGKYVDNTSRTIAEPNDFFTGVFRDVATNFLTSAASWRLREVSIGYDIPARLLAGTRFIKGASVTFSGRNLFLWLPKSNVFSDPDFTFLSTLAGGTNTGTTVTTNTSGVGTSQINPPVRTFGANVTLTF